MMSNMYPGVETINPVHGSCPGDCAYCYRNGIMWRFKKPKLKVNHWDHYHGMPRLAENFNWQKALGGKAKTIFVCSMIDLLALPFEIRDHIIQKCMEYPQHKYLWHTKWPLGFQDVDKWPPDSVLVTTIETDRDTNLISCAHVPYVRFMDLHVLRSRMDGGDFALEYEPLDWTPMPDLAISIEPVMKFDLQNFVDWIEVVKPAYVSIGADTGKNGLPEPSEAELRLLVGALRKFTEVRIKDGLRRLWKDVEVT